LREKKQKIDLNALNSQGISLSDALGVELPSAGMRTAPKDKHTDTMDVNDLRYTRIRLSLEKKGRAGKIVTKMTGLQPEMKTVIELIKSLKQELGCGASIEKETVYFQGDQRQRIVEVLQKKDFSNIKCI